MQTTKTNARRRRTSNRFAGNAYPCHTVGISYGQPRPVSFYLNRIIDGNGKVNKEALIKSFNTECYA